MSKTNNLNFYLSLLVKTKDYLGGEDFDDFIFRVRGGLIGRITIKKIIFEATDFKLSTWHGRSILRYIKDHYEQLINIGFNKEVTTEKNKTEDKGVEFSILKKIDPYKFLEEAARQQEFKCDVENPESNVAKITLSEKSGGYMVALADLHFGNPWTNYPLIIEICRFLESHGINIIIAGDLRQNFLRPIKGNYLPVAEQSITPHQQLLFSVNLVRHWIEIGILKLLVRGNHDMRDVLATGTDFFNAIDWTIPVYHNRCEVIVKYGGCEWLGVVTHKENGRSENNPNFSAAKSLKNKYPYATFIINAHYHVPGYQEISYNGRMIPLIQLGCFNQDDTYSRTSFGSKPFIFCPILKFVPGLDTPLYFRGLYQTHENGSSINGYEKLMG